jgi:hypothetical protein
MFYGAELVGRGLVGSPPPVCARTPPPALDRAKVEPHNLAGGLPAGPGGHRLRQQVEDLLALF